jgi:glycosyltransferase involved in cell wall biosynthesis
MDSFPSHKIEYRVWSPENEVPSIQSMSVGLMPLAQTEVARAKSAAKLLTYAACGIPIIASPIGVNSEIMNSADIGWSANSKNEWLDALGACFSDPKLSNEKGLRGRNLVLERFSAQAAAKSWARLLHQLQ